MNFDIVIVDDDAVVLFLQRILIEKSSFPCNIFDFSDPSKALIFVRENKTPDKPMLILLDINMPGMSGWDFLNALETMPNQEHLFVAMVTSSINYADRLKAKDYQLVVDYIEKPLCKKVFGELHHHLSKLVENS